MALLLPSPAVASAQPRQSRRPSHSQYCPRHLRSSVVCSFSLPGGFAPLPLLFGPRQQPRQQQQVQEYTPQPLHSLDDYCEQSDAYGSLMHQAEEITFSISPATLSMLEEAERMVEVCIQERPQHLQPRVLLLRNLMRQAREGGVPALALQALHEAGVPDAEASMMRHLHVLQIVMLGLKATYKLQEQHGAAPMPVPAPQYSPKSFLAAAKAAAPSFTPEFDKLSLRVQRQLLCCGEEQRSSMLQDATGYMSSVDLSAVCGQHHVAVGRGDDYPTVIG